MVPLRNVVVFAAFMVVACLMPASAQAAVIVAQHLGDTDPTTEGFSFVDSGSSITIGPVNDGGTLAWQTDDTNGNFGLYQATMSGTDETTAKAGDWRLTINVRVEDTDSFNNGAVFAQVRFNNGAASVDRRYSLFFSADNDGDTIVAVSGGGIHTSEGTGNTVYHTYELYGNGSNTDAVLFVDGVQQLTGITPTSGSVGSSSSIRFGSGGGSDQGQGNWAEVTFETGVAIPPVPEPASAALVGLGSMLVVMGRRR